MDLSPIIRIIALRIAPIVADRVGHSVLLEFDAQYVWVLIPRDPRVSDKPVYCRQVAGGTLRNRVLPSPRFIQSKIEPQHHRGPSGNPRLGGPEILGELALTGGFLS
jgi:hypothetical protein